MKTLVKFLWALVLTITFSSCHDLFDDSGVKPFDDIFNAETGGVKISAESLPDNIKNYLSTNYSGKSISKVEKYSNKYEVELSDGTKLEFDLSGKFIEISKNNSSGVKVSDDPQASLPQSIRDYLNKNYPGVTIVKAEKSLNKYEIKLSNRVRIDFDLNGKVIRIRKW